MEWVAVVEKLCQHLKLSIAAVEVAVEVGIEVAVVDFPTSCSYDQDLGAKELES